MNNLHLDYEGKTKVFENHFLNLNVNKKQANKLYGIIGPSGIGKTIFCKQFIYNGLAKGESCIYLTTDESPLAIENSMENFVVGTP